MKLTLHPFLPGPALLFVTLSPDNITDKVRIKLSTDAQGFLAACKAKRHERESHRYTFPGAEALSFHHLVQRFLHSGVGWDRTFTCTSCTLHLLTLPPRARQLTNTNPGLTEAFSVTFELSSAYVHATLQTFYCTLLTSPYSHQVVEEQARGALHLHLVLYMHGSHRCT